jgi:hypothetical protein
MKIESGKRYIDSEGRITAPLKPVEVMKYTFIDPETSFLYDENGRTWGTINNRGQLIDEYIEEPEGFKTFAVAATLKCTDINSMRMGKYRLDLQTFRAADLTEAHYHYVKTFIEVGESLEAITIKQVD